MAGLLYKDNWDRAWRSRTAISYRRFLCFMSHTFFFFLSDFFFLDLILKIVKGFEMQLNQEIVKEVSECTFIHISLLFMFSE